ncbi:MAG TPA: alpha/beta hydrolase [Hyphomicrobiaceae bacterium]|jgi:esterase/lipase superfamily enzyme
MAEPSPPSPEVVVLIAGLVLYVFIWFATRDLSRVGKILARLAPLGLVIPIMVYLSSWSGTRPDGTPTAPTMSQAPPVGRGSDRAEKEQPGSGADPSHDRERQQAAGREETSRRVVMAEEAERRAQAEARRTAEQAQGAQRPAEVLPGGAQAPAPSTAESRPAPGLSEASPPPAVAAQPEGAWDIVPVFYGTDRQRTEEPKRISYGAERARRLELGRALVTVPKTHQVPNIERPFAVRIPFTNITLYEQDEDPKQHFTLRELKALTREQFLELVRERISGSVAFKDQAVVFVHGYNTAFEYAVFRTAQMAYDLKFDSASFLYSWPSEAGLTGYGYDRESSEQAEPYLREYLELVVKETGAKSVSVIAHSMGNMPLLRVLQALGPSLPPGVQLNQIILAAPDVDRNLFENLAANIMQYGRGVTLYCSSNDRAMAAARRVAGGVPRAGDVPADGPIVLAGIDTIDVSQTSTDYLALNHSSYAETGALLNDIGLLLQTGERPPEKRIPILQRITTPKGDFWRYPLIPR